MSKTKFILFTLVALLSFSSSKAQESVKNLPRFDHEFFHWGYYVGVSFMDFKIYGNQDLLNGENLNLTTESHPSFNVGLLMDFRLSESLNLRFEPGVNYTSRSLDLLYAENVDPNLASETIRNVQNAYIDIPIYIKYGGKRRKNFKPYIILGPKLSYDMLSKANSNDDNTNGYFRTKPFNVFLDGGVGIDWYLPYFRWSTEIKGSFALLNELVRDGNPPGSISSPYTDPISKMNSRGLFIVMKFE